MFRRKRSIEDFAEEIRTHLELEAEDLREEGLPDDEAQRKARADFGNIAAARERFWLRGRVKWLGNLRRDMHFALRQLVRRPAFSLTAILVLALGSGVGAAIFSFVYAALVRPLPFRDPGKLVSLFETVASCPLCNVSFQNFLDWRHMVRSFESLDVWGYSRYALPSAAGVESIEGARVSDGFFRTLGVSPLLGRSFYPGEDAPGARRIAVLSYGGWRKRFGGARGIIGKQIELNDVSYTVVGVLPPNFHFAPRGDAEVWTPLNDPTGCDKRRGCHGLFGLGRLKDGVTIDAASAEMRAIAADLEKQYPDSNRGYGAIAVALKDVSVGQVRGVLIALMGGAGLLLLIAYVNTIGLVLLRSEGRRHEIAVRTALGASAGRVMLQFLAEGFLLTLLGVGFGLVTAWYMVRTVIGLIPAQRMESMPFLQNAGIGAPALAFVAAVALAAVLFLTVAPSLQLRARTVRENLTEGGRGAAGRAWKRLGSKLVVVELATSVVLLTGAGLLGKSLYELLHVETGFIPDHLASVVVDVPKAYKTDAQVMALERGLLDRARNLPGAVSVGLTVSKPIRSWDLGTEIVVPGSAEPTKRYDVPERDVNASYFPMLGAKLLLGRYFTDAEDDPAKPRLVIINQSLASELFSTADPIGRRIAYAHSNDAMQIVGVVKDIKEGQLDTPTRGVIYVPFNQNASDSFELLVRSSQAPGAMLPMLIAAVHEVDKGIATSEEATMDNVIRDSSASYLHRTSAVLVGCFATFALVLSIVGLYGVVAYSVTQRTREIGVRMALGAQSRSIFVMVLQEAGWLTGAGLFCGLICAAGSSLFLRDLLFGVRAWDGITLVGVTLLLGLASIVAGVLPARRAALVNPVDALRAE